MSIIIVTIFVSKHIQLSPYSCNNQFSCLSDAFNSLFTIRRHDKTRAQDATFVEHQQDILIDLGVILLRITHIQVNLMHAHYK